MWYRFFKQAVRVVLEPEITAHQTPSMYKYPAFTVDPDVSEDPTSQLGASSKVWGPGQYTSQNPYVQKGYYSLVGKRPKPSRKRKKGTSPRPQGTWKKQNKTRWERIPRGTKIIDNDNVPPEHVKIILDKIVQTSDFFQFRIKEIEKKIEDNEIINFNELKSCLSRDKEIFPLLIALGYDALEYTPFERSRLKKLPNESDEDYEKRVEKTKNAGKNILIFNRALLVIPRIFTKSRLRPDLLTIEEIDLLQKEMYQSSEDILQTLFENDAFRNANRLGDDVLSMILDKGEKLEDYPNLYDVPFDKILRSLENGSNESVISKVKELTSDEAILLSEKNNFSFNTLIEKIVKVDKRIIDIAKERLSDGIFKNAFHTKHSFDTLDDVKYAISLDWDPNQYSWGRGTTLSDKDLLNKFVEAENWHNSFDQIDKNQLDVWESIFNKALQYSSTFETVFPGDSFSKVSCEVLINLYDEFKYSEKFIRKAMSCKEFSDYFLENDPKRYGEIAYIFSDINSLSQYESYVQTNLKYIKKYPDDKAFFDNFKNKIIQEFNYGWRNQFFKDLSYDQLKFIASLHTDIYRFILKLAHDYNGELMKYIGPLYKDGLVNAKDLKSLSWYFKCDNELFWVIKKVDTDSDEKIIKDEYFKDVDTVICYLEHYKSNSDLQKLVIKEAISTAIYSSNLELFKYLLSWMSKLDILFTQIYGSLMHLGLNAIEFVDLLKSYDIKLNSSQRWEIANYAQVHAKEKLSEADTEILKQKLDNY